MALAITLFAHPQAAYTVGWGRGGVVVVMAVKGGLYVLRISRGLPEKMEGRVHLSTRYLGDPKTFFCLEDSAIPLGVLLSDGCQGRLKRDVYGRALCSIILCL